MVTKDLSGNVVSLTACEFDAKGFPGHPDRDVVAIGNMDGTWWVDWDSVEPIARLSFPDDARAQSAVLFARLLSAARGHVVEVSCERADEIAREYAERLNAKASA